MTGGRGVAAPAATGGSARRRARADDRPARLALAALLCAPALARAKPVVERLGELTVDFSAGAVEVRGVGAPSLESPSAQVGRVEAERSARADAGRRLRRGVEALPANRLGCNDPAKLPALDRALADAQVAEIDWGSDGSVKLTLRIKLASLAAPPTAVAAKAATRRVVLVEPRAVGALFGGGGCASAGPAPPLFATLDEARAAGVDAGAPATREAAGDAAVAAIVRSAK